MSERLVEARGVCAGYGTVPAIIDVNMHLDAGEMVALLGANGAGKTTTLLALAGALRLSAGAVTILGVAAMRKAMTRRILAGLALLPEHKAIFMGLTVRENLLLGRGPIEAALHYFPELKMRLNVRAGLTSGGEQQMLVMARTLAANPRVILADELSLGLAPLIVQRLLEALSALAKTGVGVVIVEQHPHTALKWTDRAYIMRRGQIELSGDSAELLGRIDDVAALYL